MKLPKHMLLGTVACAVSLTSTAQSLRDTIARNEYGQICVKMNDAYYPEPMSFVEDDADADFVKALRGYVEGSRLDSTTSIKSSDGSAAWDFPSYYFIEGKSPATVHKNLWRMEKLNNINGLFQVLPKVEGAATPKQIRKGTIFQIRSYDLATMSFVKSKHGWIVIDPLMGDISACAAWEMFRKKVDPKAKISAIIITHSHVDHYKGVEGMLKLQGQRVAKASQTDMESGKYTFNPEEALVIAPAGFYDEAISENLYLGNAMGRRAAYMYGSFLPRNPWGSVGAGLGKTVSKQKGSIPTPSFEVKATPKDGVRLAEFEVDGLNLVFQDVPGTEAPSEFHIYFKDYKALCPGENLTQTMHNLLTPRGAKVRDPKAFAQAIDATMSLFSDVEVIIGTHHWPTWNETDKQGNKHLTCLEYMEKQRDMYYYFNNQVIHLLNKGYNMEEIGERFTLPSTLRNEFYNRGYYGTLNHNAKAVVQRYVGWWDGNPANYFKLPEVGAAHRFGADMGGADKVMQRAKEYFDKGDYRWTIELTKNVVFDNPSNQEARELQADAMEQLAYSFEAGTWRNIFLSGAFELRGKPIGPQLTPQQLLAVTAYNMKGLTPAFLFEYMTVLIDGEACDGVELSACCKIGEETYKVWLKNSVLHYQIAEPVGEVLFFASVSDLVDTFVAVKQRGVQAEHEGLNNIERIFTYIDIPNNKWNIVEPLKE